ncbi:leucine-rich repeat-containing protein 23-like [Hydractinia symbiolongicarpus]|uniref:leucine-rich repeat-containing protein 23-like n=1 Tax=Hydractinia symbiolongicarpus TaxID=13093 RepID=UPI00254DAAD6|nr:leucine-rich repeat-containing protein 23-like [Hydractinia symbiolongicarpus]
MSEFSDFDDEEGVDEPVLSDNDQDEKEEEEEFEDNPLTQETIRESLSLLCKVGNGLSHAYVRLDIHEREITDISILTHFVHLRYVDISGNNIKDISPLNCLKEMLTLKADKNQLKSAKMDELPYLQHANFSDNKISDMEGIIHPLLEVLNLNGNEIAEVKGLDPPELSRLTTLELRSNKLTTTAGISLQSLKKIYLGQNAITQIEDLARLEHLTILHLRQNNISKLDGFSENMKQLQYLNLRKNNITEFTELHKLKCLPRLRALILRENPVCYEEGYRVEVLVILPRLERLDQDIYEDEERQEAEEIYNQRAEAENQGDGAVEVIQSEDEEES